MVKKWPKRLYKGHLWSNFHFRTHFMFKYRLFHVRISILVKVAVVEGFIQEGDFSHLQGLTLWASQLRRRQGIEYWGYELHFTCVFSWIEKKTKIQFCIVLWHVPGSRNSYLENVWPKLRISMKKVELRIQDKLLRL